MLRKLVNKILGRKPKEQNDESFWAKGMQQFRKNKLAVWSLRFVKFLIAIALLADFLANEKPIVAKYQGETYFPIFKSYAVDLGLSKWPEELKNAVWQDLEYDWVVRTPVPYSPSNMDQNNDQYASPFDDQNVSSGYWRHWLGTDALGRDVLAGLIHGSRVALMVGIIAMFIATLIGLLLGSLAGYFGDEKMKISRIRLFLNLLFLFLGLFYAFGVRGYALTDSFDSKESSFLWEFLISLIILVGMVIFANLLARPLKAIPFLRKKVRIPIDIIIMRFIDVMLSIPTLLLILAIIAITGPSITVVMVIIGLTRWPAIARLMRGELLRIRSLEYIEAAHALGFSEFRTIMRHAIPNAMGPVMIAIAFGIAAAILIEAFLSFIGAGVPPDQVTWGSQLAEARSNASAWWLAIFPGLMIFFTVTVYNLIGEGLTDAFDPKLRK